VYIQVCFIQTLYTKSLYRMFEKSVVPIVNLSGTTKEVRLEQYYFLFNIM